jgi:hypothetical protein
VQHAAALISDAQQSRKRFVTGLKYESYNLSMSSVIRGGKPATLAPKSSIIERNLQGGIRFNRIAALLALVTVAMLFVAPVIPQTHQ